MPYFALYVYQGNSLAVRVEYFQANSAVMCISFAFVQFKNFNVPVDRMFVSNY